MKKVKVSLVTLCSLFIVFGMVSNSSALLINLETTRMACGPDESQSAISAIIDPLMKPSTELYKATPITDGEDGPVIGVSESGPLAGSYNTTYLPPQDKEDATITYVQGTNFVGPIAYLLAKDGKANDDDPLTCAWYLYNLTSLGWNGTQPIEITGLWPDQGSFSHVTLYGVNTPVPVPPSVWLLGSGLVGLVGLRRRFFRK